MKKILYFALALLVASCSGKDNADYIPPYTEGGMDFSQGAKPITDPGSDTPRDPAVVGENQIKIVSFNIRTGGADTGTSNAWTERRSGTPQMLSVENPTIFGLQEAQLYQADYVKSSLEGYDYVGVSRDTGTAAGAGERMPIFWKTSLVQLEDWGTFWLSSTPEIPSVGWAEGSTYRRCATWARFRHIATGKRFFYINTHLDLVRDNRIYGMDLIATKLKELNPSAYPSFLTGDMNESWPSAVFDPLNGVMDNLRETASETDHFGTFNGFKSASSIIDFIFVSGFKPVSYRTVNESWNGIKFISDHFPISGLVEFEE